jgi:hypothetical protein
MAGDRGPARGAQGATPTSCSRWSTKSCCRAGTAVHRPARDGPVLARSHARTARAVHHGLYRKLLDSYGDGILQYDSDKLKILGTRGNPEEGRVMVDSEVRLEDGTPVPISYRLRIHEGSWKVYDVVVEGISYVTNYRNQYASEFRAKGVEGVIAQLQGRERRPEIPALERGSGQVAEVGPGQVEFEDRGNGALQSGRPELPDRRHRARGEQVAVRRPLEHRARPRRRETRRQRRPGAAAGVGQLGTQQRARDPLPQHPAQIISIAQISERRGHACIGFSRALDFGAKPLLRFPVLVVPVLVLEIQADVVVRLPPRPRISYSTAAGRLRERRCRDRAPARSSGRAAAAAAACRRCPAPPACRGCCGCRRR